MSKPAKTKTTTRVDPRDSFERTAIVLDPNDDGEAGSIDLVDSDGRRIAQLNITFSRSPEEVLIVDVIDVDDRYRERRVLAFSQTERTCLSFPKGGTLASVDLRKAKP